MTPPESPRVPTMFNPSRDEVRRFFTETWRQPRRRWPRRTTTARWTHAMRVSSICMRERMRGSRPAFKLGHLSGRDSGDASRQAGGCFPHATGGGMVNHDGHASVSPCRIARGRPDPHARLLATLHGDADR
nr:hypothetical protein [Burkholderia territorii]